MCFLPIDLLTGPLAGFFERLRQLFERLFHLGFPVQVLMDVHFSIALDCDAVRKQCQNSSSAA
jgi:hypothetical protein